MLCQILTFPFMFMILGLDLVEYFKLPKLYNALLH